MSEKKNQQNIEIESIFSSSQETENENWIIFYILQFSLFVWLFFSSFSIREKKKRKNISQFSVRSINDEI